jgi:hypothetical protein
MAHLFVDATACLLCHCLATDDAVFRLFSHITMLNVLQKQIHCVKPLEYVTYAYFPLFKKCIIL